MTRGPPRRCRSTALVADGSLEPLDEPWGLGAEFADSVGLQIRYNIYIILLRAVVVCDAASLPDPAT